MRERQAVKAGTVFLLLPGEWHRYRPALRSGWTEDWFELRGELPLRWANSGLFAGRVFRMKDSAPFFRRMDELHRLCHGPSHPSPGQLAAIAMWLLAEAASGHLAGAESRMQADHRELVARARELLREGVPVASAAREVGLSYPTLHRIFKQYTGIAPKQYTNQWRLARAESLLMDGRHSLKEIAAALGYYSTNHFSAAFKSHYGLSPSHWRRMTFAASSLPGDNGNTSEN